MENKLIPLCLIPYSDSVKPLSVSENIEEIYIEQEHYKNEKKICVPKRAKLDLFGKIPKKTGYSDKRSNIIIESKISQIVINYERININSQTKHGDLVENDNIKDTRRLSIQTQDMKKFNSTNSSTHSSVVKSNQNISISYTHN